jgi:hypothetical protein
MGKGVQRQNLEYPWPVRRAKTPALFWLLCLPTPCWTFFALGLSGSAGLTYVVFLSTESLTTMGYEPETLTRIIRTRVSSFIYLMICCVLYHAESRPATKPQAGADFEQFRHAAGTQDGTHAGLAVPSSPAVQRATGCHLPQPA